MSGLAGDTDLISNVNVDPERKPGTRDHQDRREKHLDRGKD